MANPKITKAIYADGESLAQILDRYGTITRDDKWTDDRGNLRRKQYAPYGGKLYYVQWLNGDVIEWGSGEDWGKDNPIKSGVSKAQLAARALFAKRAKAGTLKAAPKRAPANKTYKGFTLKRGRTFQDWSVYFPSIKRVRYGTLDEVKADVDYFNEWGNFPAAKENPIMTTPTKAQLAARALFAKRAKAGTLKDNPTPKKDKPTWIVTLKNYITKEEKEIVMPGGLSEAEAVRNAYYKISKNPERWKLAFPAERSDEVRRRRNPAKKTSKRKAPNSTGYGVIEHKTMKYRVQANGPAGFGTVADFAKLSEAEQYGRAYADMSGTQVRIVTK